MNFHAHPLIVQLMETICAEPHLTTAALIERFRDSSSFDVIRKLASLETFVSEETLSQELHDTLAFLTKKNQESEIQTLLKRAKEHGLTEEERPENYNISLNKKKELVC